MSAGVWNEATTSRRPPASRATKPPSAPRAATIRSSSSWAIASSEIVTLRQEGQAHQPLELSREPPLLLETVFEALHQSGVLEGADDLGGCLEDDRISRPAPGRIARAQGQETDRFVAAAQRNQEARAEALSAMRTGPAHCRWIIEPRFSNPMISPGLFAGGGDFREIARRGGWSNSSLSPRLASTWRGSPVRPGHDEAAVGHRRLAQALEGRLGDFAPRPCAPRRHRQRAQGGRFRLETG